MPATGIHCMLIGALLVSYLLAVLLFFLMCRPIGLFTYQTFTFAPGILVIWPLSLLGFVISSSGTSLGYTDFRLNPNTYAFLILFNLIQMLASMWAMTLGYRWRLSRPIGSYIYIDTRSRGFNLTMAFFFLLTLTIFVYLHARFHFAYISNPRGLYEVTRQGFGHFYFIMATSMKLCFVMLLFSKFKSPILPLLLFLMALGTGSKTHAFVLFLILITYKIVFSYKNRIPTRFVLGLSLVAFLLITFLFSMTFHVGEGFSLKDLSLLSTSFMNEGTNNTVLLMDTYKTAFQGFQGGSIFLENNVFTRLPRILFPGKPVIFGSFRLADMYFYEHTSLGVGAKTFGTTGDFYADFGYGAFAIVLIMGLVFYGLAGIVLAKIIKMEKPEHCLMHFAILIVLCNVYFIQVPPGNNLPENLLLVLIIGICSGLRKVTLTPTTAT